MTLTVGTNAYVTVADVSEYLAARGQETAWEAANQTEQEAAIVEATSFLDAAFSWNGRLEDADQALGWPRVCVSDREGRALTGIPVAVEQACCELANLALGGRLQPMQLASVSASATKRERVGDVEVEYDTAKTPETYGYVLMLLQGLGFYRGGRSDFVKLVRT